MLCGDFAVEFTLCSMRNLRLILASTDAEHSFAQELTKQNMERLTKHHWGEWRSDVLSAHYPVWTNFLIYEGSERIGYVGVEEKNEALSLHNLQIQDKYRNHGIGEWALSEIVHQFPSCKSIVGSVFKDNQAVSFFKKQGFEVIGEDEHCLTIRKRTYPGSPHGRCAMKPRSAGDFYVRFSPYQKGNHHRMDNECI